LCTTLYVSLEIIYGKYTGARGNDFTARGYLVGGHPHVQDHADAGCEGEKGI
jgi:hypothetical protein